ncbi:MAG: GNAT family N-acetyltransferase [Candidatus Merdivicinus sp.]
MQDNPGGFATRLEQEGPASQDLTFRIATEEDIPLILYYIRELATYERLEHEVTATEEILREYLFRRKNAEVLIGEANGQPVGYALFFHNFSTFLGKSGLYLEDLYVHPAHRGRGFGRLFLRRLAQIALERGCGRMEWCCLDWNESSIRFYKALGARPMEGWTTFRLDGETLKKMAE